jgi:outer membrane protein assembly factor BamB
MTFAIVGLSLLIASATLGIKTYSTTQKLARLPQSITPETLPAQATNQPWSQLLPRTPLSNLSYSSDYKLLIYGTEQKTLDAVSIENGTLAFTLRFAEPIVSEPLIDGNRLYVGEGLHEAQHARLVAIQLPQGTPLWQHEFLGHVESMPALTTDHKGLIGCAGEAGIFSVDLQEGKLLWKKPIGHCDTTPLIENTSVYALAQTGEEKSTLIALQSQKGDAEWSLDLPGAPWGTIARDSRTGYLLTTTGIGQLTAHRDSNEKGWLHAIDSKNRKLVWTVPLAGMPLLGGILFKLEDRVLTIHTLKNGEILAFNTSNGSLQWKFQSSSPILSLPRLLPGTNRIVTLALDGTLCELNAATGQTLSKRHLGAQSTSAPALSSKWAFFSDRANLWALPISKEGLQ